MQRRKFLIGAGGTVIGGSALIGTGAIQRIHADRDSKLVIATDENAYLGLKANPDSPFSQVGEHELIEFNFGATFDGDVEGSGINNRADTEIKNVFSIINQSNNDLYVWVPVPEGEDPTSGGARSVELIARGGDNPDGIDITFPKDEDKDDYAPTSRSFGMFEPSGAVHLKTGEEAEVDVRFLVWGSGGPRDFEGEKLIFADVEEPTSIDDWIAD